MLNLINNFYQLRLQSLTQKSETIISQAYAKFPPTKIALAWTGGKDSTLLLWLVRNYAAKYHLPLPKIVFINEGDLFLEITEFTQQLAKDWKFSYTVVGNDDILSKCKRVGDTISTNQLSANNQRELKRLNYSHPEFIFAPESFTGNHLMKTVPLNSYIRQHQLKAVVTGIRWDEHPARAEETYFSPRKNPPHTRVHPILHFTEKNVWQTTKSFHLPYVSLYDQGYRSLGAKTTTDKISQLPAWKQDLLNTQERDGRAQDKENIMHSLRKLGYM